ncbi:MAG TPA: S8 family serine peptidase, partial [Bacteroidia bacterium]|nr:S8 family serine peptidase [Bacteroidia bacterium]
MKRIYTLLSLLALGPALFAINGSPVPVDKNAVNVASLKPDDYMHNTLILKVLPEYRSLCSVERINIPAVNDFFLTMGEDQCGKKYPRHEAPKEKFNKYGMPMIDLSLIYEIHYTGAMPMDMAIAKLMNLGFFEYVEPHIIPKISFVPNDPQATQAQSYYLYKIAAAGSGTTGWDIETGNSNVVIGIVDTGTEYTHSDLSNQIKISSTEISGNGIDDDGDGYIDNYRGWDVAMNDNDATWEGNAHGVAVCGDACAQTNNNNKVAGPGYNCKILPVKIADASGTLTAAYDGIVYAADHGCQVINCSWGGPSAGSYGQNIIDYAMNNKDALVVVAAANDGSDSAVYPAAYDNSMSVAATNSSDGKAYFSNYNYTVDVCSPGQGILNTWINNGTISNDGTSMASPVCAGVCAIVRAHYPSYNCYQTKQRVKTTADNIYSVSGNSAYQDKLGTGRIN